MKNDLRESPVPRDRHGAGIRRPVWGALCALLVVAALGCANAQITYQDAADKPVKLELGFFGRGCIAYEMNEGGKPSLALGQDGSTDWLSLRIIPTLFRGAVSILFGRVDPNADSLNEPSGIGGCDSLFTNVPVADGDEP